MKKATRIGLWASGSLVALAAIALGYAWQPAIGPLEGTPGPFSAEQIARGERLAALGDCAVCHTREGGPRNAGGRALPTPFGTIYSSNLTPDRASGIGGWSYPAFERAMRHGVARDGSYLYPAFPYTAFTRTRDEDLKALYAYLMSQPAVHSETPANQLPFPFDQRQLMAGWNLSAHFAGGEAEGWTAPALNASSPAPIAWSEEALYAYLRHGYSAYHGVASGPMAPVVGEGLAKQSDEDLRALAHYLASYAAAPAGETDQQQAQRLDRQGYGRVQPPSGSGARLFAGACLACHHDGDGPRFFGVRPSLALNSNVHADSPDNLLRIILDGIHSPATGDLGYMPGFRHSLDDRQVAALANYLRERFAGKPAWPDLAAKAASLRQQAAP
ncbi:c-type cytochrome [Pseudomonas aeruginosa]|uniref:c-type cytochrome n=1 Tax=Pseudomonas aeruginosa TaxID=287 RepID=UPI000FF55AEE|nr:c-type cytochrome [Pseudomonas aeruginosa]RPO49060.1 cytochrome C [Pseudomonas aeruginosa]